MQQQAFTMSWMRATASAAVSKCEMPRRRFAASWKHVPPADIVNACLFGLSRCLLFGAFKFEPRSRVRACRLPGTLPFPQDA
jgi:hypothetical protein